MANFSIDGSELKRYRKSLGWTQEKLGKKAGNIHFTTISHWESEKDEPTPQKNKIEAVALALTQGFKQQDKDISYESILEKLKKTELYTKSDFTVSLLKEIEEDRKDWNFVQRGFTDDLGNSWDIEKILTNNENIIILGDAGSGKTTQLQSIALELAKREENQTIPIFIDISRKRPFKKMNWLTLYLSILLNLWC